jgi:multidrug efflux pump subunit AcrB
LFIFVGIDFFPGVDAGLIQLHVRAPARTRVERTEQIFQAIEDNIRKEIPAADLHLILDNIGLLARTYNLAFTDGSTIGVNDGVIQIELAEGHAPTADIIKKLRAELARAFPDVLFYFQPADLVTQVLNFGVPRRSMSSCKDKTARETRRPPPCSSKNWQISLAWSTCMFSKS